MIRTATVALLLLGCSSTTENPNLFGNETGGAAGAAGASSGGAAGSAGAAGSPAGGEAGTSSGGAAGQGGAPGGGGAPLGGSGGVAGAGGQGGAPGGGTGGVDPCSTCKVYPNGTTSCKGTAANPSYWEHCPPECTPAVAGKVCTKTDTYATCSGFTNGCSYWCCA